MKEGKTRGSVKTSSDARRRPIRPPPAPKDAIELPIKFELITEMQGIQCGLRQEWIGVRDQSPIAEAVLATGVGLGSPWLLMTIRTTDGRRVRYRADMRPLFQAALDKALGVGT